MGHRPTSITITMPKITKGDRIYQNSCQNYRILTHTNRLGTVISHAHVHFNCFCGEVQQGNGALHDLSHTLELQRNEEKHQDILMAVCQKSACDLLQCEGLS